MCQVRKRNRVKCGSEIMSSAEVKLVKRLNFSGMIFWEIYAKFTSRKG